jgi:hypothetical protein
MILRPLRSLRASLALLALFACKKDPPAPEVVDAGFEPPLKLYDKDLGIDLTAPGTWRAGGEARTIGEVKVLLDARRAPVGHPYLVAPRLVITSEPTGAIDAKRAADRSVDDLIELEQKGQLRITRKVTGERRYGDELASDVEIAYEVKAEGAPVFREVEQRSLFVLRRLPGGSRAIVTFTVTYLSEDASLLSPETEQTWNGLRLVEPGTEPDAG